MIRDTISPIGIDFQKIPGNNNTNFCLTNKATIIIQRLLYLRIIMIKLNMKKMKKISKRKKLMKILK